MKKRARFTADTAAKTGKSERSVQLDAARGERLRRIEAYQGQITNTSLDKGAELDALTRLPIKEAQKLITSAANGEAVSAIAVERARKNPLELPPPRGIKPRSVPEYNRRDQVAEQLFTLLHQLCDIAAENDPDALYDGFPTRLTLAPL
jgi:hypothetical protein